ncbi:hypothetical protein QE152_g13103 [Popillia japonica]|uniref:Uncharacterized protein n=1 Tax=Popillia japonica TaxID=7064 RepID=A0AAW1LEM2_POPJA
MQSKVKSNSSGVYCRASKIGKYVPPHTEQKHADEALRDRLVCGLSSETVQKKLLSEVNLTFARACSLAQAHEMAEMQSKLLTTTNQVHHIRSRSTQSSNFKQSSVPSSSYTSKKGVAQSHSHKNVAVDKDVVKEKVTHPKSAGAKIQSG